MTEQEWLSSSDSRLMLAYLQAKPVERKLRLFTVACCRRFWHLLKNVRHRMAVEAAECSADDVSRHGECALFFAELEAAEEKKQHQSRLASPEGYAELATLYSVQSQFFGPLYHPQFGFCSIAAMAARGRSGPPHEIPPEFTIQAAHLRDIFGNPFRPITFNPAWRTSNVSVITQAIYEDRIMPAGLFDNLRLGVLADALEEAGCDNTEILGHLRDGGDHARGCWVVDLLLGKS